MLAQHFRPFFVFDSAEAGTLDWEPLVLYQAHPLPLCPEAEPGSFQTDCCEYWYQCIRITYVALWQRDHGYGPCSLGDCDEWFWYLGNDDHPGDVEAVTVRLESSYIDGYTVWKPTVVEVSRFYALNPGRYMPADVAIEGKAGGLYPYYYPWIRTCQDLRAWASPANNIGGFLGVDWEIPIGNLFEECAPDGFNPLVFLSAHKHHVYLALQPWKEFASYHSDYQCCDDLDGARPLKVIANLDTCPGLPYGNNVGEFTPSEECRPFFDLPEESVLHQRYCVNRHHPAFFVNVLDGCAAGQAGQQVYPHENVWEEEVSFCGGCEVIAPGYLSCAPTCGPKPASSDEFWSDLNEFLSSLPWPLPPDFRAPPLKLPDDYRAWREGACSDTPRLVTKFPRVVSAERGGL